MGAVGGDRRGRERRKSVELQEREEVELVTCINWIRMHMKGEKMREELGASWGVSRQSRPVAA